MTIIKKPIAALCASLAMAGVHAQDTAFDIDIAPQPLPRVLDALTAQTGVQTFYADDAVRNLQSPGVKGHLRLNEAIERALAGTGLTYQFTSGKTVAIKPASPAAPSTSVAATMLAPITVTAMRVARRVDEVPASVSVLSAADLDRKNRQNLYDALRDTEGLDFGYSGSVAQQVAPTIRGVGGSFSGSTTQVLVDGMGHDAAVSNLLGHGGLNFTAVQDIERVEIMRGPASALYGPGVIGGVINIIPKHWQGDTGAEINASYGSHATRSLGIAVGTANEKLDLRLSGYAARSDGYRAIPTRDKWGQLDYAPRDWTDDKFSLIAGYHPNVSDTFTLSLQSFATRSASQGGRPQERHDLDGQSATLGYRHTWDNNTALRADLRVSSLDQKYRFDEEDWNGDIGNFALAYLGGRSSDTAGLLVQLETHPFEPNTLIVGYSHDDGDYESWGQSVGGTRSVTGSDDKIDALFVQDEHKLGAWVLSAGLRYDRIDLSPDTVNGVAKNGSGSIDHVLTPRLGARYFLDTRNSLYATAGRGYLPALNSFKFVQPSTTRTDNPDLDPETSTTYEIGSSHRFDVATLRTAVYHTNYRNKIALGTDTASGLRQWQNIAVVKVDGIELAVQGQIGGAWQPYANFNYTHARDYASGGGDGTQSLRVAPRRFNAGLTYAPDASWSATVNARAVSHQYFNALTTAERGHGYGVIDAKVQWTLPFARDWTAFAACNNLGDRSYSEWNSGEYADGRTFTVGMHGAF